MKKSPFIKIIFTIVLALLIPLLSYTIYQFVETDKNEALIRSIYENQLNTILFSINQNSSDVFNSWISDLNTVIASALEENSRQSIDSVLASFVARRAPLLGAVLQSESGRLINHLNSEKINQSGFSNNLWSRGKFETVLSYGSNEINTMIKRAKEGYINPIAVQWLKEEQSRITLLIFPVAFRQSGGDKFLLTGLFLDDYIYVEEVVARKIRTMDISTVELVVRDSENGNLLYSTEEFPAAEFERETPLWILPDLNLQIKLTGSTLEGISSSRARNNLIFLGIVNLVLLLGIFYLIRNVRMQMKLARMQTDFVANVSHELRTPLAVIRMFAETLEMGRVKTDEKKQHYFRSIMDESTRLTQLINNILDFAKIESKKKSYNRAYLDIKDLVNETLDMYNFHLQQKGFVEEVEIEEDLPKLYLDSQSVKQAFLNLLENAVKFSVDEKKIVVKLQKQENQVWLTVQDFGIGIPESEQKKIFEKFYRATNTRTHQTKGSGLGLVLVNNIMRTHGGKVYLKSKIGKGSSFSLIFPIPKEEEK